MTKLQTFLAMICVVILFCAAAVIATPAQSIYFTTLLSFAGGSSFGATGINPYSSLIQTTDGNFYGTTTAAGFTPLARSTKSLQARTHDAAQLH